MHDQRHREHQCINWNFLSTFHFLHIYLEESRSNMCQVASRLPNSSTERDVQKMPVSSSHPFLFQKGTMNRNFQASLGCHGLPYFIINCFLVLDTMASTTNHLDFRIWGAETGSGKTLVLEPDGPSGPIWTRWPELLREKPNKNLRFAGPDLYEFSCVDIIPTPLTLDWP